MSDDDAGFFRSLSGLASEWVASKRRALQTEPRTKVDASGGAATFQFSGQDLTFEDLRDIKAMREDGGQVAQLMTSKALLNFGEGAEFHVSAGPEEDALPTQRVDGVELTLKEWLDDTFPHLDLLVLDLGEDALWYPYAVGETLISRSAKRTAHLSGTTTSGGSGTSSIRGPRTRIPRISPEPTCPSRRLKLSSSITPRSTRWI